jgi:hypothetical protein
MLSIPTWLGGAALAAFLSAGLARPVADPPALVVLVTMDQLRGDYLERFGAQLEGGLARFTREGVWFADAHQDHAITSTAPGHSTLLSGRPPASTGIVTNGRGVPDAASPLVAVQGPGASPHRFRGTTLFDWMLARDSATRVLSVSYKDRGAILPIGRARGEVYWYRSGLFTTSTWYRRELPAWLRAWNARDGAGRHAGRAWTLLREPSAYPQPDSAPWENGGRDVVFPHAFPADSVAARQAIARSPYIDSLTLDVALAGVRALDLGRRGAPDLLAISLSGLDLVGHAFGPDSREVHDHLLRVDAWLGVFMDSLAMHVPRARTVFVLTSDHGVQAYPQSRPALGVGHIPFERFAMALERELEARWRVPFDFEFDSGLLVADIAALRARGVDVDSLGAALARRVEREAGVGRVFTPRTLAAAPARDAEARLWRRTLPADEPWLLAASSKPGWLWGEAGPSTGHGSTVRDDTHVPVVFLLPEAAPRRVTRRVTTEDIGPTLAALAGVRPTEPVVGKVLPEVAGRPATGGR